ncbi:MBL fold metallo-hydrolase [Devosia sp. MC1541]|uniref:MBL fold metallo-hydrolase n=1 Tax=Devosia sp. MC1541 TaxID=2725264 RepID=UPI00145D4EAD|nr:MBL fold metallo-hydrolase [Devosia sp. MC1541]
MIRVGDIIIDWVEELVVYDPPELFGEMTSDELAGHSSWLTPDYFTEENGFYVGVLSWIIRTPTRTILVDTGAGNDKVRPTSPRFGGLHTPFLEGLAQKGITRDRLDLVILTHLHLDHVGWNTLLNNDKWVPTFPNTRHIVSAIELAHRDPERGAAARPPATWQVYNDSVRPLVDAGLLETVEGTEDLGEGLSLIPLPGHSPGQMGVRVQSQGQSAMCIADVLHQPIQVYHPSWNSRYCEDQETARTTRAKVLAEAADYNTLLLPAHFGNSHCGYVHKTPSGYSYEAFKG